MKISDSIKNEKAVDYAKKYKKIFVVIWIFILMIIVFFARNFIILNVIANKMSKYQSADNFYMREYDYFGHSASTTEIWQKNADMFVTHSPNNIVSLPVLLVKDKKIYTYLQDYDKGTYAINSVQDVQDEEMETTFDDTIKMYMEELRAPISILKYKISKSCINGKKCYQLTNNEKIIFFDRDTGLIIRLEELVGVVDSVGTDNVEVQSTLRDYYYKFNCVTDEDIVEPSIETK